MKVGVLRMAGLFGVASPLVGFAMVLLSIRASPWFSWTGNALSDLGASGFGSVLFNSGLPMAGAVTMVFSTGLFELTRGSLAGRLGSALHLSSALLLCGIGVFNINVRPWHYVVSVAFFVSMPLALWSLSAFFYRRGMRPFSALSAAAGAFSAAVWVFGWSAVAIPEALAAGSMGLWQVVLGLWMFTGGEGS